MSCRVSTVSVGPSRSTSTRLTLKRGLDAVAITVIRYRSSAAETCRSAFCQGSPVGTKTTSSRLNRLATSEAATRCPWWIGSKVPPITPTRRVTSPPSRRSGVLAPATEGGQCGQHSEEDEEGQGADREADALVDLESHDGHALGEDHEATLSVDARVTARGR